MKQRALKAKILKQTKRIVAMSLVVVALVASQSVQAKEDADNIDVHKMTNNQCRILGEDLTSAFVNNDVISLNKYQSAFTEDCYTDYATEIKRDNIHGKVISIAVDRIETDNSDTGDTVLMVNSKIRLENSQLNELYLIELHVDKNGKIYGFNYWAY